MEQEITLLGLSQAFSNFAWGYHLLLILVGGGAFFMIYSRFIPFFHIRHAINVLRGKYDDPNSPGEINHFQALSSAIAATVGMGNVGGVAVAISIGGPGALFWMWISAIIGMATKFFTGTLSVMYRGKDSEGKLQGGAMYFITEGLGKKWRPMAVFFCICGMFGMLPVFQANQLTEIMREVVLIPNGFIESPEEPFNGNLVVGLIIVGIVSTVIFGGLRRIADVASKLVPAMIVLYLAAVIVILFAHSERIPETFILIFTDAFEGAFYDNKDGHADGMIGGIVGALIVSGFRRAAFSNEAGIGTATLAHGAAKTDEPVREGLVAMIGPAIDTLLVCSLTALAILVTDSWQSSEGGIGITLGAFQNVMPDFGPYVLILCAGTFALTTLFTFSYFGTKCFGYVFGAKYQYLYNYFYVASVIFGAVTSVEVVINLFDGFYAMMALPNMLAALMLSAKVRAAAKDYFRRMREQFGK